MKISFGINGLNSVKKGGPEPATFLQGPTEEKLPLFAGANHYKKRGIAN
jgi:hypothetical protein